MSWCTSLLTTIDFSKESYTNIFQVEEAIDESKELIADAKNRLNVLACMTEPKKFISEDDDPMFWIQNEIRECLETIQDESVKLYKLEILYNEWDRCHTDKKPNLLYSVSEDGKVQFKEMTSQEVSDLWYGYKSYIGGDFIK